MYLLYVDESGSPYGNTEHYVLGGVAVFERQTFYLSQQVDEIQDRYFPGHPDVIEFHASDLWAGRVAPWSGLTWQEKSSITLDLLKVVANANEPGLALFGVAMKKTDFPHDDPVEKALEQLIIRFDQFLSRRYYAGDNQRGLMIFDDCHYQQRIQTLMTEFTRAGTRFGRIRNYCDIPLFTPSSATRMLQLADLTAYSIFRRYESGDVRYLDAILHRFDREPQNRTMHGFFHLVSGAGNCFCPACMSRRQ